MSLKMLMRRIGNTDPEDLGLEPGHVTDLENYQMRFLAARGAVEDTKTRQMEVVKQLSDRYNPLRTMVRTYYYLLNAKIRAGLVTASDRRHFSIAAEDETLPGIWSMKHLVHWGERIWIGEQKRRTLGKVPVNDPNPFELDMEVKAYDGLLNLSDQYDVAYQKARIELDTIRKEGVKLMRKIYANLWMHYTDLGLDIAAVRRETRKYGMIFINTQTGEVLNEDDVSGDENPSDDDTVDTSAVNQTQGGDSGDDPNVRNTMPELILEPAMPEPFQNAHQDANRRDLPMIMVDEDGKVPKLNEKGEVVDE